MSLVLDSTVTLAWIYADELTAAIRAVFDQVTNAGAWVPSLWRLEVANVLEMGVRRKKYTEVFRDATLADLAEFPIRLDPETDRQAWGATVRLAASHG